MDENRDIRIVDYTTFCVLTIKGFFLLLGTQCLGVDLFQVKIKWFLFSKQTIPYQYQTSSLLYNLYFIGLFSPLEPMENWGKLLRFLCHWGWRYLGLKVVDIICRLCAKCVLFKYFHLRKCYVCTEVRT